MSAKGRALSRLVALVLSLWGCGAAPTAPRLTRLRLSPEGGIRPFEILTASVDFVDEDADLIGGIAEIGLRRDAVRQGEIFRTEIGGRRSLDHGTITVTVQFPAGIIPGSYDVSVTVIDRAMRRSNPLVDHIDIVE